MKFSELQLNANVLEALDAMRFDECTPIQEQAIPVSYTHLGIYSG